MELIARYFILPDLYPRFKTYDVLSINAAARGSNANGLTGPTQSEWG